MFRTNVAEEIKTHTLCSVTFFRKSRIYGVTSKNVVESEAADNMAPVHGILDK
jgi:hypothetical protein